MIRIYKYIATPEIYDQEFPPVGHNYKTGLTRKLYEDRTMSYGAPVEITFYANFNGGVYSDPVVRENWYFERDSNGFPVYRKITIQWFNDDGSIHDHEKELERNFTLEEAISESRKRRKNIMQRVQYLTLGLITGLVPGGTIELGRAFIASVSRQVADFIEYDTTDLADYLTTQGPIDHPWLLTQVQPGVTIQAFLIDSIQTP